MMALANPQHDEYASYLLRGEESTYLRDFYSQGGLDVTTADFEWLRDEVFHDAPDHLMQDFLQNYPLEHHAALQNSNNFDDPLLFGEWKRNFAFP